MGPNIARFCIDCLASGCFPQELNNIAIVLIPKKKTPANMGDLRPIALCQVLYKIMSKMITNRLKTVLPSLISPSQSAFVAG